MDEEIASIMGRLCAIFGIENVILAGGAVRDWKLGKEIKDYDFFIDDRLASSSGIDEMQREFSAKNVSSDEDYPEDRIVAVYNGTANEKCLQFIFTICNPREMVTEEFDYNLCMCYYDPDLGEFVFAKEFTDGVKNKVLINYIDHTKITSDTFSDRMTRMTKKFSDYKYLVDIKRPVTLKRKMK